MTTNAQSHTIEALFKEARRFEPTPGFATAANAQPGIYEDAERDYEAFWKSWADRLEWMQPFKTVLDWKEPFAQWFLGGKLNASVNCLDRHVRAGRGDAIAYHFEGEPGDRWTITYADLLRDVCRFANGLRRLGIKKGDRVAIYLPMIPELPVALLACARIGAAHSVVFGGFSADAIVDRAKDAECVAIITADQGWRRGKKVPLKETVDVALDQTPSVTHCIVAKRVGDARRDARGTRRVVGRPRRERARGVRTRSDGFRRPALSALHERHDGQTQGHHAYDGRLSDGRHGGRRSSSSISKTMTSTGARPTSAG